jgi:hypothetical protein
MFIVSLQVTLEEHGDTTLNYQIIKLSIHQIKDDSDQ